MDFLAVESLPRSKWKAMLILDDEEVETEDFRKYLTVSVSNEYELQSNQIMAGEFGSLPAVSVCVCVCMCIHVSVLFVNLITIICEAQPGALYVKP